MKAVSVILWTIWFGASFFFSTAGAEERVPEEYVYLLKSKGGKVYRIIEQSTREKKETVRKEIRRMEIDLPRYGFGDRKRCLRGADMRWL